MANSEKKSGIFIGKINGNPNLMMAQIYYESEKNLLTKKRIKSSYLMNLNFLHFCITLEKDIQELKSKLFLDKNEQRVCDWSFLEPLENKRLEETSRLFDSLMKQNDITQFYNNNKMK